MSVLPQSQGPGEKQFFYVLDWNRIYNKLIFRKFWFKKKSLLVTVERSWLSVLCTIGAIPHLGLVLEENILFYVFDRNHIKKKKLILLKISRQVHCLCQCNIQVFSGWYLIRGKLLGQRVFCVFCWNQIFNEQILKKKLRTSLLPITMLI